MTWDSLENWMDNETEIVGSERKEKMKRENENRIKMIKR